MAALTTPLEPAAHRRDLRDLYVCARRIAGELLRGDSRSWSGTDLAHEALARVLDGAWAGRVRDDPRGMIRALRTIVRRTLVDYDRARHRQRAPLGCGRRKVAWDDNLAGDQDVGPLDAAIDHARFLERVRGGLSELELSRPAAVVEVAELAFFLGLTQREIAAHTGIPQTTVSSWLRIVRACARREAVAQASGGSR